MKGNSEIEAVFYAKIGDFTGLTKADEIEEHVQVETRLLNGDKARVRKVTKGDQSEYIFTAKTKTAEQKEDKTVQASTEYSAVVSEEFFEAFIKIAEQVLVKTRYYFKNQAITFTMNDREEPITLDNVGYEVDVFKTMGKPCEWAKIDVELDALIEYMGKTYPEVESFALNVKTTGLPINITEKIYQPVATEEQKQFLEQLWQTQFAKQLRPESTPVA